jgi:hypothetical protein
MLTMSSIALPKVAFKRPPTAGPTASANSSVAKDNSEANGTMARKFRTKITKGGHPTTPAAIPKGTNTNRTLM